MDFTKDGKCSGCGECCSDTLHLSQNEIVEIDEYLKTRNIKPIAKRVVDNGKPTLDNRCPFRNEAMGICNIYQVRPQICRVYMCNKEKLDSEFVRDVTNHGKLPRSMRLVFFGDNENQKLMYEHFKIKLYGREEK